MGVREPLRISPVPALPNTPRRRRVQLDSIARVRRETAKLYVEARDGRRDVSDASKLGNLLAIIARMLEGSDLERRIEAIEAAERKR